MDQPLRLHIGGEQPKPGWTILNVAPGPHVDVLGDCRDLSAFADASVDEVYASHVLEHLSYKTELHEVLVGIHRILRPRGLLHVSVPDFDVLCRLFLDPRLDIVNRFKVMRMMFGGQLDAYDVHKVGLNEAFLADYLRGAGFSGYRRVAEFKLFDDSSSLRQLGRLISLNVTAIR